MKDLRTNFLDDSTVIRTFGNRLVTRADVARTITATIPAALAAAVILLLSTIRLFASLHDADRAQAELADARTRAVYPLETRQATIDRAAHAELVASQLHALHNQPLEALAPLVNIGNALPSNVRIKTMTATRSTVAISSGEAISYGAIVDARNALAKSFPTTIATMTIPSLQVSAAPANSIQNTSQLASFWGWTANITVGAPGVAHPHLGLR